MRLNPFSISRKFFIHSKSSIEMPSAFAIFAMIIYHPLSSLGWTTCLRLSAKVDRQGFAPYLSRHALIFFIHSFYVELYQKLEPLVSSPASRGSLSARRPHPPRFRYFLRAPRPPAGGASIDGLIITQSLCFLDSVSTHPPKMN